MAPNRLSSVSLWSMTLWTQSQSERRFWALGRSGLAAALITACLALLGDQAGFFDRANDIGYQFAYRIKTRLVTPPARVLLVYAPTETLNDPVRASDLLDSIAAMQPSAIGLISNSLADSGQMLTLESATPLVLAIAHEAGDSDAGPIRDSSGSSESAHNSVGRASAGLYYSENGVYSVYPVHRSSALPSLAQAVAEKAGAGNLTPGKFRVDYRGSVESLPHVTAQALQDGFITPQLVAGRAVLVGPSSSDLLPGVATPTSGAEPMRILEIHGHALNTLLNDSAIRDIDGPARACLFACVAVFGFLVFRRLSLLAGIRVFLATSAIWVALQVAALALLHREIPLGALLIFHATTFLWTYGHRLNQGQQGWRELARRGFVVNARYQHSALPSDARAAWSEMAELAQLVLPLDRLALYYLPEGKRTLTLVTSLDMEDGEPPASRFDVRMSPFREAFELNGPLRIDETKPFYDDGALQIVLPLTANERPCGVAIIALPASELERCPRLLEDARRIGDELGALILRMESRHRAMKSRSPWRRRFGFTLEQEAVERAARHIDRTERRLHEASQSVETSVVGRLVYDTCGRLVRVNDPMNALLERFELNVSGLTLVETLTRFTGRDHRECRSMIRDILLRGQPQSSLIVSPSRDESLLLVMHPLFATARRTETQIDPFEVFGISVELIDGRLFSDIQQNQSRVATQALDAIDLLLAEVQDLASEVGGQRDEARGLRSIAGQTRATVEYYQSIIAAGQSDQVEDQTPVDPAPAIHRALRIATDETDGGPTWDLVLPDSLPLVLANPCLLQIVLADLGSHLKDNVDLSGTIRVRAEDRLDHVLVSMDVDGGSASLEHLARVMATGGENMSDDSARMTQFRSWLREWNGKLEFEAPETRDGVVRVVIRLRKHDSIPKPNQGGTVSC